MAKLNSQTEKSLEALTSQALVLATDLSRALDQESGNSHPSITRLRHLAVTALETSSKMVVLLLKKDEAS